VSSRQITSLGQANIPDWPVTLTEGRSTNFVQSRTAYLYFGPVR